MNISFEDDEIHKLMRFLIEANTSSFYFFFLNVSKPFPHFFILLIVIKDCLQFHTLC